MNWDAYFLGVVDAVAAKSKDPSSKVGAVVVRPDKTIAATGWNGFPRGVDDKPERYADRPTKYRMVCHAEANAIVSAREPLTGCTIYLPWAPCCDCAKLIIQAGITEVVHRPTAPELVARWGESFEAAQTMFRESGVTLREVDDKPRTEKPAKRSRLFNLFPKFHSGGLVRNPDDDA